MKYTYKTGGRHNMEYLPGLQFAILISETKT